MLQSPVIPATPSPQLRSPPPPPPRPPQFSAQPLCVISMVSPKQTYSVSSRNEISPKFRFAKAMFRFVSVNFRKNGETKRNEIFTTYKYTYIYAFMSTLDVIAACPFCMSILHVYAKCLSLMSLLHVYAAFPCWMSMPHVDAACPCCIFMPHVHKSYITIEMLRTT